MPNYLQTSGLDNALELIGHSLSRKQAAHELPVEAGGHPMRALAREDELVDEGFRGALVIAGTSCLRMWLQSESHQLCMIEWKKSRDFVGSVDDGSRFENVAHL
jgi:hypothetical protein